MLSCCSRPPQPASCSLGKAWSHLAKYMSLTLVSKLSNHFLKQIQSWGTSVLWLMSSLLGALPTTSLLGVGAVLVGVWGRPALCREDRKRQSAPLLPAPLRSQISGPQSSSALEERRRGKPFVDPSSRNEGCALLAPEPRMSYNRFRRHSPQGDPGGG